MSVFSKASGQIIFHQARFPLKFSGISLPKRYLLGAFNGRVRSRANLTRWLLDFHQASMASNATSELVSKPKPNKKPTGYLGFVPHDGNVWKETTGTAGMKIHI